MEKILLSVDYVDTTGKFWSDSFIKNKIITLLDGETVHQAVKRVVLEIDGMALAYNGKPQGNIFVDDKDGNAKPVGYLYRGNTEIYDRDTGKSAKGLFDVWVNIKAVSDYPIEEIVL